MNNFQRLLLAMPMGFPCHFGLGVSEIGKPGLSKLFKPVAKVSGYLLLLALLMLSGCSSDQVEELAFRKTMEYQLKEKCEALEMGAECIMAIEEQIAQCMQQSDWKKFLESDGNDAELLRFTRVFFSCFKDPRGASYFSVG